MKSRVICIAVTLAVLGGCQQEAGQAGSKRTFHAKELTFGIIGKSNDNPIFQAARQGALDAAKDLSTHRPVKITVEWRTPDQEDPQKQISSLEELTRIHVNGIGISCSDAGRVTEAINAAVRAGIPVMCWDSDAPQSKRFCYHGLDNFECGRQLLNDLAKAMGSKGTIAILAGSQGAPNLQERVRGVRDAATKLTEMKIKDVYYHAEDPQSAAAKVKEIQTANPDIQGWAMIGGWALLTDSIRKNPQFAGGKIKIVSVGALPESLEYLRAGVAEELLAQDCYQWGYRAIQTLYDKAQNGPGCPENKDIATLTPVTKANVNEFARKWEKSLSRSK